LKTLKTNKMKNDIENTHAGSDCQKHLVRRLRNYHRQLDAHQRKREAAVLLADAADEIEKLRNALEQFYTVNTRFGIGGLGLMEYQKANFDAREALFPTNVKVMAAPLAGATVETEVEP
jgi:hypothetical protein